ncbi:MAG: DUF308 domain-containing protein [Gemmataceae bacterium]
MPSTIGPAGRGRLGRTWVYYAAARGPDTGPDPYDNSTSNAETFLMSTNAPGPTIVRWRVACGLAAMILGIVAVAMPFVAGLDAPYPVGWFAVLGGTVELLYSYTISDERQRRVRVVSGELTVGAGLLLFARPMLIASGLAILLAGWFAVDGITNVIAAMRHRTEKSRLVLLAGAAINLLLAVLIAIQWPLSGSQAIGMYVGIHVVAAGWAMLADRAAPYGVVSDDLGHPDRRLGLAPHAEVSRLSKEVREREEARRPLDLYWQTTFVVTFLFIHIGRMEANWNLVGLVSPIVAVIGDLLYAMIFALAIITPLGLTWRWLTRPIERRAWSRLLSRVDAGRKLGPISRIERRWLIHRMHFAERVDSAYRSPRAAVRRALHVGLPPAAILVAMSPLFAASWFFNTENWGTGLWERWTELRVDDWRTEMIRAVRGTSGDDAELFRVTPEGVAGTADFSFVVIGDTGEGDASQHVLRDQFLGLMSRPEFKFLVVSSDVIYPSGAMKDYEPKFYLPFKGVTKPIYAVPGNHDWYDALEAFGANFLEPTAARAALRARVAADHGLTTTTERHIDALTDEAAVLRREYGVQAGRQKAPYFEVQTDRFALIVVDTGILKSVDADQLNWVRSALKRSHGKFTMAILGHPLYAGGHYRGNDHPTFAEVHKLLHDHGAEVVVAGDTHDFEYYREPYETNGVARSMAHFVTGGGGAYLSIGTALAWPKTPAVRDTANYPRADAIIDKLNSEVQWWKQPMWYWTKRLGAWPSSPELMSAAFNFDRAPFFQHFLAIHVEGSSRRVRVVAQGVNGPLHWRDLQLHGDALPTGQNPDGVVEWVFPLGTAAKDR